MTHPSPRWLIALAFISSFGYATFAYWRGVVGFPLDDAWIHQTYARNLVQYGEWAFVPGRPSAGSTSPLWALLLALGYLLRIDYRIWTYLLGAGCLAVAGLFAFRLSRALFPDRRLAAGLAGALVVVEWHLVWASVSGMETTLFVMLTLATWGSVMSAADQPTGRGRWPAGLLGLVAGLTLLARPDGLTLAPFAMLAAITLIGAEKRVAQAGAGVQFVAGFALVTAPYLLFNLRVSGSLWPNTYYAKQAEYAALRMLPYWRRLLSELVAPFVGGQVMLVPGLIASAIKFLRGRQWRRLLPLVWAFSLVALYAWRLPVTYQHGRYIIPVVPIMLIYGVGGSAEWLRINARSLAMRVISRTAGLAFISLSLLFYGLGARAYVEDVSIINAEMVATARWLAHNTPPGSLIAAHDIGAVGYYAGRPLLDLAGLVSPEVIPFIRDESKLLNYLREQEAEYLMTFPGWYPAITGDPRLKLVYISEDRASPNAGGENMAVYRLDR